MGIEEMDDGLTPEQRADYERWLSENEPPEAIPQPEKRDCKGEILEVNTMFDVYEHSFDIAALYALHEVASIEEGSNHPLRKPAKEALIPIWKMLDALKKETNISEERYRELWKRYKYIFNAVGSLNDIVEPGRVIVEHDREWWDEFNF